MPEPNPPPLTHPPLTHPPLTHPPLVPSYGHLSLDALRRRGVEQVEFWCLDCRRQSFRPVATLIARVGPGTTLLTLARRARCGGCGRSGCHVQEAAPPAPGTPGYRDWLRAEVARAEAFLSEARARL